MAILKVDQSVLPQTLRLLLQLAENPNDVRFTHGIEGSEVHVSDELALEFLQAVEAMDETEEPPHLNGNTPHTPPASTPKHSVPSKKAKR